MKEQGTTSKRSAAGLACLLAVLAPGCSPSAEQEDSSGDSGKDEGSGKGDSDSQNPSEDSDGAGESGDQTPEDSAGEEDQGSADSDGEESDGEGEPEGEGKKEVPDEFKGKKNPFDEDDEDALKAGKALYVEHCEGCHAKDGSGELPGMPDMSSETAGNWPDDWTYWKVLKGGGEMMPAAEGVLDEEEIWQCITYFRGFSK